MVLAVGFALRPEALPLLRWATEVGAIESAQADFAAASLYVATGLEFLF